MRLSKTSEYAIRIVLALAASSQKLSSREISDRLNISYKYVGKIMLLLVRHNILSSTRGSRGGFQLARPANTLNLRKILEIIDGKDQFKECLMGFDLCRGESYCVLHHPWQKINEQIIDLLQETTVDELVKKRVVKNKKAK